MHHEFNLKELFMKKEIKSMMLGVALAGSALLLSACGQSSGLVPASTTATYQVTIQNNTNSVPFMGATAATDRMGLNFSRFAILTHKTAGSMWDTLHPAPTGIVHVSEWGKVDAAGVLNGDISLDEMDRNLVAQNEGFSNTLTNAGISPGDIVTFNIQVNSEHPYISLAGMIAPSADFFAGFHDIKLYDNGSFVNSKTVSLLGYSAESRTLATVDLMVLRNAGNNPNVIRPNSNITLIGNSDQVPSRIKTTIRPDTVFGTVTITKL